MVRRVFINLDLKNNFCVYSGNTTVQDLDSKFKAQTDTHTARPTTTSSSRPKTRVVKRITNILGVL